MMFTTLPPSLPPSLSVHYKQIFPFSLARRTYLHLSLFVSSCLKFSYTTTTTNTALTQKCRAVQTFHKIWIIGIKLIELLLTKSFLISRPLASADGRMKGPGGKCSPPQIHFPFQSSNPVYIPRIKQVYKIIIFLNAKLKVVDNE